MRILFFSDVHANIYALRAMLGSANYDSVVFLGDAVDYGTRPAETIDELRALSPKRVMGNHDHAAAKNTDCLCAQENHDLSVYTRRRITLKELSKSDLGFLAGAPIEAHLEFDNIRLAAYHGSPNNPLYGYLYPWQIDTDNLYENSLGAPLEENMVAVGHTHYMFTASHLNRRVVNPGSVGQPRDDDPRPSYLIMDTRNGSLVFHRFDYPREQLKKDLTAKIDDTAYLERLFKLFRL